MSVPEESFASCERWDFPKGALGVGVTALNFRVWGFRLLGFRLSAWGLGFWNVGFRVWAFGDGPFHFAVKFWLESAEGRILH